MNHLLCAVGTHKLPLSLEKELSQIVRLSTHLPQTSAFSARWEIHHQVDHHTREALHKICERHKIDIGVRRLPHKKIKLAVFDMDSTLIGGEVIDELAKLKGVGEQVKSITARAMNGEIDFTQSLKERVALLKGLHRHQVLDVHHHLPLNPGVLKTAQVLRENGIHTAIITGGFTFFAEEVRQKLNFHEAHANTLSFIGDELSGLVEGKVIDGQGKRTWMEKIAQRLNLTLDEVAAVGDGANDLPMIKAAGLGVAYHAKPQVRIESTCEITYTSMTTLLDYMDLPHAL
jgi:phosphoserine phosphatase